MFHDEATFWPVQRSLTNFRLDTPLTATRATLATPIETVEKSPGGLVKSFTTLERGIVSRRQSRQRSFFLSSPIPKEEPKPNPPPVEETPKPKSKPKRKLNTPIDPRNHGSPRKLNNASPSKSVVAVAETPREFVRPSTTPRKPPIPQIQPHKHPDVPRLKLDQSTPSQTPRGSDSFLTTPKTLSSSRGRTPLSPIKTPSSPSKTPHTTSSRRQTSSTFSSARTTTAASSVKPSSTRTSFSSVIPSSLIGRQSSIANIEGLQKFESPYKKVAKLHGMDTNAKPAFTIKPTNTVGTNSKDNGGPMTSTPKPSLANANLGSLRKMTMTSGDPLISPADKARIEEARARMQQLDKEEEELKKKLKEEEEAKAELEKAVTVKPNSDVDSKGERASVKGNLMVATDPSTFARNSINMIYTKPKSNINGSEDDKPAFDPAVFAKTIIKSSNLTIATPRKDKDPPLSSRTTTTIASTKESVEPPPPVEEPINLGDSGLGEEPEKKKEKRRKKDKKSDYEKLLKCHRCKKRYMEPKIACCQRMCVECLQKLIDKGAKSGLIFCRVCNRAIIIPDSSKPKRSWAKQFPTDHFLSNLKDAVEQLEGKRLCYVCDSRSKVTDATMFCYECDTYFCDSCDDAHRHMPKLKHHRLISLNELTPTELLKHKKRSCTVHEGKPLELFCKEHNQVMCADCASTIHKKCTNVATIANVASEKKKMLKDTEKTVKSGIVKCEVSSKRMKGEATDIAEMKKQTVEQIEGAFHAVTDALTSRRKKLIKDINTHFSEDIPQFDSMSKQMEKIRTAMKTNTEFINELMNHASDLDVIENADRLQHQADVMVQQNAEVTETPKPKLIVKMDDTSVQNFVELVSLLGAEVGSTQVKGIMVKKMTTKMSDDKQIPDIRDIVVMDSGAILAIDNKNSCVKGIIFQGDHFQVRRLALQSEPWGGTRLQDNVIAVTGLKVFYIICLADDLILQSTVHTRKDYWGICALSPINLACSCKYPACVDIVDITGRRLRTIDTDPQGRQLFEMPGYLGNVGGRIVVSDRAKKALICVDQMGDVVFTYKGEDDKALQFPRGISVDKKNRIYVADHDKGVVYLISPEGQFLCTVINVSNPRTICLDSNNNTLFVSMEGKGITFFNIIEIRN